MTQLSHAIRAFNRFELKYLLSLKQAERFKTGLKSYLIPDEHGNSEGRYPLTSLYFDSADHRCYWEKIDGLYSRRKLRIRSYEPWQTLTADTPVFVEIKQRIDRVTQKRRAQLPYQQALQFCCTGSLPFYDARDEATIHEVSAFITDYRLQPVSIVRYDRQAYVGTNYDIGLRVTFDTQISSQPYPLDMQNESAGLLIVPADMTVMEIKVNERIPYWLTELVAFHNLKMIRMSKYCLGMEVTNQLSRSVTLQHAG